MSTWKKSWFDYPIVVIDMVTDTEDAQHCAPLEIAAVRLDRCRVTARVSTYCRPSRPVSAALGYDQELLDASPDPAQALTAALALAGSQDAVLCAWDAQRVGTVAVRLSSGRQLQSLVAKRDWLDAEVWTRAALDVSDLDEACRFLRVPLDPNNPLSAAEASAAILCSEHVQQLARGTLIEVLAEQKRLQLEQVA